MKITFDIDKFVSYLNKYKSDLPTLYNWNPKIDHKYQIDTTKIDHHDTDWYKEYFKIT